MVPIIQERRAGRRLVFHTFRIRVGIELGTRHAARAWAAGILGCWHAGGHVSFSCRNWVCYDTPPGSGRSRETCGTKGGLLISVAVRNWGAGTEQTSTSRERRQRVVSVVRNFSAWCGCFALARARARMGNCASRLFVDNGVCGCWAVRGECVALERAKILVEKCGA